MTRAYKELLDEQKRVLALSKDYVQKYYCSKDKMLVDAFYRGYMLHRKRMMRKQREGTS